jgi:hypothetical protein
MHEFDCLSVALSSATIALYVYISIDRFADEHSSIAPCPELVSWV